LNKLTGGDVFMARKKLIRGAVIGGVIVFLWCLVSWMVLPWHSAVFNSFTDEQSVANAISSNAPVSGVYILPNTFQYNDSTPAAEMQKGMQLMKNGPTMFASVQIQGMGQKTVRPFIVSLIIQIIGAGIVTWMVLQTRALSYKNRVWLVTLYGIAIGLLGIFPAWNWWGLSFAYIFSIFFDLVVSWFLAGLAIAKICK
jgi:hypothetical protein